MSIGQGMYRCKQCGELVLGQASHLCAARPDPITEDESDERVQVGWVRFDGDEFHDFRYFSPNDPTIHRLSISALNYLPVYVDRMEGM